MDAPKEHSTGSSGGPWPSQQEGGSRSGQRGTPSCSGPGAKVAPRVVLSQGGGQALTHLCETVTGCGPKEGRTVRVLSATEVTLKSPADRPQKWGQHIFQGRHLVQAQPGVLGARSHSGSSATGSHV